MKIYFSWSLINKYLSFDTIGYSRAGLTDTMSFAHLRPGLLLNRSKLSICFKLTPSELLD